MYVYPLSSSAIAGSGRQWRAENFRILPPWAVGPFNFITIFFDRAMCSVSCFVLNVLLRSDARALFLLWVTLEAGVFHFHSIVKIASIKSKHPMQNGHMRICQCCNHAWICWILNWIDQPVGYYFMIAFSLMLQLSHSAMVSFDVSHHRTRIDIIIWNSLGEAELGRSVAVIFYELLWAA